MEAKFELCISEETKNIYLKWHAFEGADSYKISYASKRKCDIVDKNFLCLPDDVDLMTDKVYIKPMKGKQKLAERILFDTKKCKLSFLFTRPDDAETINEAE